MNRQTAIKAAFSLPFALIGAHVQGTKSICMLDPTKSASFTPRSDLESIVLWKRNQRWNIYVDAIPENAAAALQVLGFIDKGPRGMELLEAILSSVKSDSIDRIAPQLLEEGLGERAVFFYDMFERWTPSSRKEFREYQMKYPSTLPFTGDSTRRAVIEASIASPSGMKTFYLVVGPSEVEISLRKDHPWFDINENIRSRQGDWKPINDALIGLKSIQAEQKPLGAKKRRVYTSGQPNSDSDLAQGLKTLEIIAPNEDGDRLLKSLTHSIRDPLAPLAIPKDIFERGIGERRVAIFTYQSATRDVRGAWNYTLRHTIQVNAQVSGTEQFDSINLNHFVAELTSEGTNLGFHDEYPWWYSPKTQISQIADAQLNGVFGSLRIDN